jgi:CRP/FNR family cyclic AMP-dependent transcriptional regulator
MTGIPAIGMTNGFSTDEIVLAAIARAFLCSDEIAAAVARAARMSTFQSRAVIVRQGDVVGMAYLLVTGRAKALLYTLDGQVILLHVYSEGDLFGALEPGDSAPQDADVVASEEVTALAIDAEQLVMLAQQFGCIGLALSRMLLRRLRNTTRRMYEHAALSAVGRVHAELLRLARMTGDMTIRPAPVLSELALEVATTRETVSRAVNALDRRGLIRREDGGLTIVAPERLEEMIL